MKDGPLQKKQDGKTLSQNVKIRIREDGTRQEMVPADAWAKRALKDMLQLSYGSRPVMEQNTCFQISTIIGYNAYGDKQITTAGTPEKYYKTLFNLR